MPGSLRFSAVLFFFLSGITGPAWGVDVQVSQLLDAPDPATRGGSYTYTINVENNAADTADGVVLTLPLPATTSFVSVAGDPGCSHDGGSPGTVTCSFGSLIGTTIGGPVKTITVTVQSSDATGATLSATATVTTTSAGDPPGNNSLSQVTTINDGADLEVSANGSPDPVTGAGNVSWSVNVVNHGPNSAGTITVINTLPATTTYQSASGSGWSCGNSGQTVTCTYPSAATGAVLPTITIVSKVTGAVSGTITNAVTVSSITSDPVTANNTITANVTVEPGADLSITKSLPTPNPAISGQNVSFTLQPRNNGPSDATSVTVNDTLPAGYGLVSAVGTGWSCSEGGGTVTCSRAAYAVGAANDITVTLTTPEVFVLTAYNNSASISGSPSDVIPGNNTANRAFNLAPNGADLQLVSKAKSPNPVAEGANITSTITLRNNGPNSAAAGTVTVTDTLDAAKETYVSSSGTNWSCAYAAPVVSCTYNAALAANATSTLTITTRALTSGSLVNNAQVYYSGFPADWNSSNDAIAATISATSADVSPDLVITKNATTANGNKILEDSEASIDYLLTVTNPGPGDATGVVVTDTIPGYISGSTGVVAAVTANTSSATFSCSGSSTITCTQTGGVLEQGRQVQFTVTVTRPLRDGNQVNTATVNSTTLGDPNRSNNSATDTVTVQPIADVQLVSKVVTPASVKAGTNATYVLTFRNNGPSTAQNISVADVFTIPAGDSGFTLISVTPSSGSCGGMTAGNSYGPGPATPTLTCTLPSMASGNSQTVTVVIRPNWMAGAPSPRTLGNTATISTTTRESVSGSDNGNNLASTTLDITQADVDLLVNNTDLIDPLGYDPAVPGNNVITYQNSITNRGPSVASGVTLSYTITPPAGKTARFLGDKTSVSGGYTGYCNNAGSTVTGPATLTLSCAIPGNLAVNASTTLYLDMGVESAPVPTGDTYTTNAGISANEPDSNSANDSEGETSTVRVRADLVVTKVAATNPVQLRQPFLWSITVHNNGPGDSQVTTLTDTLPDGVTLFTPAQAAVAAAPYNAAPYSSGITWSNNNSSPASGSCSVAGSTISCDLGLLETGKDVTISVPVRIPSYPSGGTITNCAGATTSEVDPNSTNNTNSCGTVTVQRSSLGGTVYTDNNTNNGVDAGEGIGGVTVTLSGTDDYGNAVGNTTATTDAGGLFTFSDLSPGVYQLVETQPSGYYDRFETAGAIGGTVPAPVCDGTTNCGNAAGLNTISAIPLPGNTAAGGFLFQEYRQGSITGYVYHDANNNGDRGAGETTVLSGQSIVLSGTAYNGVSVCTVIAPSSCTATTNASGIYTFATLPPSDGSGYTITQTSALPAPYLDGLDQKGDTIANVVLGSAGRATPESMTGVILLPNQSATEHNFGELRGAAISGFVYLDADGDAVKDAGETYGLTGVAISLTGTDDLGNPVGANTTTAANGSYSFTGLRPGTYQVTETPPTGVSHTGAQAGSKGGTINSVVRAANVGVPGSYYDISAIPIVSNDSATGYNFGESGQGLSGFVYVDSNGNGVKDAGEPAISGVAVTLSGTTSSGANVCTAISPNPCTITTNGSGAFSFTGLPASNGTGYTITEQSHASAPLTNWADGAESLGTVSGSGRGTVGNDQFTGIVIGVGEAGSGYNFGERGGSLGGSVYHDVNNNGTKGVGESGIAGVTVTLSGTTANNVNVCTVIASCTATTDAGGNFLFTDLPASNGSGYTLTETQPAIYGDGLETAGSSGGTPGAAGTSVISGIVLVSGGTGNGYLFGERLGSLSGTVFHDANGNGAKDGGELGIAGVTVTLTGNDATGAAVTRSTSSDLSGTFTFTDLPASNGTGYTITETQPVTHGDGAETVGSLGGTSGGSGTSVISGIVFTGGANATGYLFAELSGSITGAVYHDANSNGVRDMGENGIAGVTVNISGNDIVGTPVHRSVTTDGSGTFVINGLLASDGTGYTLSETQPVTYADGAESIGTAGGTAGGAGTSVVSGILLGAGSNAGGYLFGELLGGISGSVYYDADRNGLFDAGENGIGGVTVTLTGTDAGGAAVNRATITLGSGAFLFDNLPASNGSGYTLTEQQPLIYADGEETVGNLGGSSGASGTSVISGIVYPAGASGGGYNFGEYLGTLTGEVFLDSNKNGIRDGGEAGIAGVSLTLTGTDAAGGAVNRSTSSDGSGIFTFNDLPASNGTGFTLSETQPATYADGAEVIGSSGGTAGGAGTSVISGIVVTAGATISGYGFAEERSNLSGRVYIDFDHNGIIDAGEAGIGDITITLTGTDTLGNPVSRSTLTAADGTYSFYDLPGGSYTLTESHPVAYIDGRETAGSAGGTVDNTAFTTAVLQNRIMNITLLVGGTATGYNFGERTGLPGEVSGRIWLNSVTIDQLQQGGEPGLAGWRVEAVQGGIIRGSAVTAADGGYLITDLPSGSGYELRFRHPGNSAIYGDPVSQDTGYTDSVIDYSGHTIANLTLRSAANIINQNLPVDPSGVVYDAISRNPLTGASVSLFGPPGFDPALHLVGGSSNATQITDGSGMYQFLLLAAAPAGDYTLSVTPPPGYVPSVSTIIPPTAGPFDPGPGPGVVPIQPQISPPAAAEATTYYLSLTLSGASAGVVNNHIPVDPVLGGAMTVRKTTPLVNVSRGDLVPYTITVINNLAAVLPDIDLIDQLPPGFTYKRGSAMVNGNTAEPVMSGRTLRWPGLSFTANESKTVKLLLMVGSGVGEGIFTNQAWALNNLVGTPVSNVGAASVRVVPDPTFDCTDIIGKVFDDKNANGYQDGGEKGLANIRLATARGWLVTTDADGRFHIACAATPPEDRGANFIIKLDERTLPSGFRLTTENPRVVRATRGKIVKANFGATIHRVVRVEVNGAAFVDGGTTLRPEWQRRLDQLPEQLRQEPSIVRLAYRLQDGEKNLAQKRLDSLSDQLRQRWRSLKGCYPLVIEQELVEVKQ